MEHLCILFDFEIISYRSHGKHTIMHLHKVNISKKYQYFKESLVGRDPVTLSLVRESYHRVVEVEMRLALCNV